MFGKNLIRKQSRIRLCGTLSPLRTRFLFSFVKINEPVQPAAEASGAPADWGGLQASSHFCCAFVMAVQRQPGSPAVARNDNRKVGQKKKTERKKEMANAECQSYRCLCNTEWKRQVVGKWKPETTIPLKDKEVNGKEELTEEKEYISEEHKWQFLQPNWSDPTHSRKKRAIGPLRI